MKTEMTGAVLCATDFSPGAYDAATAAQAWARLTASSLILVHALDLPADPLISDMDRQNIVAHAREKLEDQERLLHAGDTPVSTCLLEIGLAEDALVRFIADTAPSIVFISSRRKIAIERWLVGTVSDAVTQSAPCPVVVVRDAKPFIDWSRGVAPLKVLAAVDFDPCAQVALRWLATMRTHGPLAITACHVNWSLQEPPRDGLDAPLTNTPEVQQKLVQQVQRLVRDTLADENVPVVVRPAWGAPDAEIVTIAEETHAHLIVAGSHHRRQLNWLWRGSVSRKLTHHSPVNVACVPGTLAMDPAEAPVPQFRRVLVATDFSNAANAVVPWACATVRSGGNIQLVHVVSPGALGDGLLTRASRPLKAQLAGLVPKVAADLGIKVEAIVLEHKEPALAIVQAAERFGADLTCLGSRGQNALQQALVGSVARGVLRRSRCPVLILPPNT